MKLDDETGMKVCSSCRTPKTAEDFYKNSSKSDGLTTSCRECSSIEYQSRSDDIKTIRRQRDAVSRKAYPERYMLYSCKKRARDRSLPFTITVFDIKIPSQCPVCKRLIERSTTGKVTMVSPSVDMYDPRQGYVPDNVWVICYDCNRRKQDMTGEDHIEFGRRLVGAWSVTMKVSTGITKVL